MTDPANRRNFILQAAADLFPGYFALVMATGIISIACYLLEMKTLAVVLLVVNIVAYSLLWLLLLLRLVLFFGRVKDDINNHLRGPGFFTIVAGTSVLGSELLIVASQFRIASLLWLIGLILWAVIMYSFFTAMTVRENKPSIEGGLNGAWLLAVVATQSVSVLGTLLVDYFGAYREPILFFTLCMFLLGSMLYIPLITLIFYRFTFVNLTTISLTPPYWINMGAVAITTLAGARLIIAAPDWPVLNDLMPFLKGFTLFFWAAGTWWIPLLLILGFWRHVYKRFPLRYDPQYWGMVFPFGMYTVCTIQLARAINFPQLLVIPRYFVYLALAGWLVVTLGLIYSLLFKRGAAA
ncbi:MAG TPA: tellurite resistance/C4-dicarboxylate transporter family protein [Pyrinomonadaceae bacterium]|nr:tellurite resistance/C4-dicarboxylate transporter family protein [Pyrinomonadaceae bacterium]